MAGQRDTISLFSVTRSMITLLLVMAGVLSFTFTRAQSVKVDFDTKVDFNKFKTYAWLAPGDSVLNRQRSDKLYDGDVMDFANEELKSRGRTLVTENPDAVFIFYTSSQEITKYSQGPTFSIGVGMGGPGFYAGGSAPVAGGKIKATSMEEGTLKYSMYDTQTKKLVWSGQANKTYKMTDDVRKIISDYTVRIFKKYPVKKSR